MKLIDTNIFLIILFTSFFGNSSAQHEPVRKDEPTLNFKDRIFTGGNLGLQFGPVTVIDVSPIIGYRITDKIQAGIGFTYQYYKYDAYKFETNVYGGKLFGRYFITDYLFAHAEYEYLNLEAFDFKKRRVDVTSLLGGAGYFQKFGNNSGFTIMLLYNFTESVYTPYNNPVFRIGFNIGF